MIPIKNKGMFLETILNITHEKYLDDNVCVVTKIPTNIKLWATNNNVITKANFADNFNCDYIGIYQGQYFEFEAKETSKKTFDFHLLRANQKQKLSAVIQHQGWGFVIVYFSEYESYFMVNYTSLTQYTSTHHNKIPYDWFERHAIELFLSDNLKLDYIHKLAEL